MSAEADPRLLVTASGVVHLRTCPSIARRTFATPWAHRYDHDRPCKVCRPTMPEEAPNA